jgi:type II secretory pathway predicted ATPase ExeA
MLAEITPEMGIPCPLTDEEREVIERVKIRQARHHVSIPELENEIGVDRLIIGSMIRYGMGIDQDPSMLPSVTRAETIEKLTAWVNDGEEEDEILYMVESRMAGFHTYTSLATHLGLQAPALNDLLNGRAPMWNIDQRASRAKILSVLSGWLESEAEDDIAGLASTPTFEDLQAYYNHAFTSKGIISVSGEVGIGKSVAAKHYLRQNPKTRYRPGVVYVELETGDTNENAILSGAVQALHGQGVIHAMTGDSKTILNNNLGSDDLLFFDESQFAFEKNIEAGKVFHNLANKLKTHVFLQGNTSLNMTLWDGKNQTLDGVANRTLPMPHMSTTKADVEAWMQWAGYEDEALIRAACKVCARPGPQGGLRTLTLLLHTIEKLFLKEGVRLTGKIFSEYAVRLGKYSAPRKNGGAK